jgi:hypothetical protein
MRTMLETFTRSTFLDRVGDRFLMHPGSGSNGALEVELVEVSAPGSGSSELQAETQPSGEREPFSLVFRAPVHAPREQGTYRIEHPELGAFDLFLVPIGADAEGVRLEAVFG